MRIRSTGLLTAFSLLFLSAFARMPLDEPLFVTPLNGGRIIHSSPALADLDADGQLEIVVCTRKCLTRSACLAAINPDGSVRWYYSLPSSSDTPPLVGDINNDGLLEIVCSFSPDPGERIDGAVYAFDANGIPLWQYNGLGDFWFIDGYKEGVFSSFALSDVDRDGIPEIAFGALDHQLHLVRGTDGSSLPGWPFLVYDTVLSTPAIADLDENGGLDIIVGADISYNPLACTQNGGLLHAYHCDTTPLAGFDAPVGCNPSRPLTHGIYLNQVLWSSPAVADLNQDGHLELVIGSGNFFRDPADQFLGKWYRVFDRHGQQLHKLDTDGSTFASPALADLDNDGDLEIIGASFKGTVYAWHHDGTLKWLTRVQNINGFFDRPILGSPVVADLDNDRIPEVIFGYGWEVVVLRGSDGAQLTATSIEDPRPSLYCHSDVLSAPAVGDINNDGILEIVVAASGNYNDPNERERGYLYCFQWQPEPGNPIPNAHPQALPWPMFHLNKERTGVLLSPPPLASGAFDFESDAQGWQCHLPVPGPQHYSHWEAATPLDTTPGAIGAASPADETTNYFAMWDSFAAPPIPYAPDSLYRVDWAFSTDRDSPDAVPSLRFRIGLRNQKAFAYSRLYPGDWLPLAQRPGSTPYQLFFEPPIADEGLFLAFSLLDWADDFRGTAPAGELYLEEVAVYRYPLSGFSGWESLASLDGDDFNSWSFSSEPYFSSPADTREPDGSLTMSSGIGADRVYGSWNSPLALFTMQPSRLYRATATLSSPDQLGGPGLRLRFQTDDYRYDWHCCYNSSYLPGESALPPAEGKQYHVYLNLPVTVPQTCHSTFDLIDFSDTCGGTLSLHQLSLSSHAF